MKFFIACCVFFISINSGLSAPLNKEQTDFNIKDANRQFDHINLQLSVQNLNLSTLNTAIATLTALTAEADQCTEDAQNKLKGLDIQIQQATESAANNKEAADLVYLSQEQKKIATKKSQCRLFSIRAKEAIQAYHTAIAQLKQEETLTRGLPLWRMIKQLSESPISVGLLATLQLHAAPMLQQIIPAAIVMCVALLLSSFFLIKFRQNKRVRQYVRIRKLHVGHIVLLASCITLGVGFGYFFDRDETLNPINIKAYLMGILFLYFLAMAVVVFIFKLKKIKAFFYWYSLESGFFQSLFIFYLSFYTLSASAKILMDSLSIPPLLVQFIQSMFLFTILVTAVYFIYYFCHAHRHLNYIKRHHILIERACTFLLFIFAMIDAIGYHTLALHLTFSGLSTFAIIFLTMIFFQGIHKLYLLLTHPPFKNKIKTSFGYKKDAVFTEFLILKTTLQVIVFVISLYLIAKSWGFAAYYIESALTQFLYGIHFGNFTFYPTRVLAGIIVYCLVYMLFRSISTTISRHQQFEDEEETQVAIASILTYIGFGIAVITGLLIAGFNFTGLAIVAGALSVGIGLGLQSIVNNFVSGLILLIEKPIKPGDRINVDGVEGFVKKIRVRSTHLLTPSREDIIVPNSDLITRRVTNYMYTDKHLAINCDIGVAYGSDTKLVEQVLLALANNHEEVIKNARSKPTVLLRSFADNGLRFQLWCLIKDANKKSQVQSELNYAIERAFREQHISMAFPQREIHLHITPPEQKITDATEPRP